MKRYLLISIISLAASSAQADEESSMQFREQGQYQECVGVSLFTMQGRELNSIVKNNRMVVGTNEIPEGWSVIAVTTKTEVDETVPYLVICH